MSDEVKVTRVFIGDSVSVSHLQQEMLEKSTTVAHLAEAFQQTPQPQQQQPTQEQPAVSAKED